MNRGMSGASRYGNVALGVESALPAVTLPARSRLQRLCSLLIATLRRWA
jgi:hypothetical protein